METQRKISLEERKKLMTDMLQELLIYSKKHDLRVYIAAGTLLGAVRHHGYIPWDDDIDVVMPLDDCKKFIECLKKDPLPSIYRISSLSNNDNHMWPFIKMIDARTITVEKTLTKTLQDKQLLFYGVYIDIFPIYGLPSDECERMKYQNKLSSLYDDFKKATRIMNRRPNDSYLLYKLRSILYSIYTLPQKILGEKYFIRKIIDMIEKYPIDKSKKFGYCIGIFKNGRDHIDTDCLKNTILLDFENIKCPALAAYDEILTKAYGDYMTLPPEEERRTHVLDVEWRN